MYEDLLSTAIAAAQSGGRVLKGLFRSSGLQVQEKAKNDLVSQADRDSEAAIIEEIRRHFPDHHILAEEGGVYTGDGSQYQWVLDPLDGTSNFVQGLPIYCVSVACRFRGSLVVGVILDPEGDNLFSAARGSGAYWNHQPIRVSQGRGLAGAFLATGFPFRAHPVLDVYLQVFREVFLQARDIRRCGSAALDLAYTAAGIYDGFFEFQLSPWDIAAGVVLIRAAGGQVTDLDGGEAFLETGNIVAGGQPLQSELRQLLGSLVSEADLDRLVPQRIPAPGMS